MGQSKKYKKNLELVDREKKYSLEQAMQIVEKFDGKKFDETVDMAIRLGVDPKQTDQSVRGSVLLPHGLGKKCRVIVFTKGDKAEDAKAAGAEEVGADDLVEKVTKGWMDFDAVVATPDMMGQVGKLGKILGPRGLMPNPKLGTVTIDVGRAVKELKAGKVEYRLDKGAVVHVPVGKKSFGAKKIKENAEALLEAVVRAKPASSKGIYVRSITVSTTMSPGVKVDTAPYMTM